MPRLVTATEARVHLGELMRHVVETQEPVIVERAGQRQVVLISVPEYERLRASQPTEPGWKELLAHAHDLIRRDVGERKLPPADEVIRQVREERDAQLDEVFREMTEKQDARSMDLRGCQPDRAPGNGPK